MIWPNTNKSQWLNIISNSVSRISYTILLWYYLNFYKMYIQTCVDYYEACELWNTLVIYLLFSAAAAANLIFIVLSLSSLLHFSNLYCLFAVFLGFSSPDSSFHVDDNFLQLHNTMKYKLFGNHWSYISNTIQYYSGLTY